MLSLAFIGCSDDTENPLAPEDLGPPNSVTVTNIGKVPLASDSTKMGIEIEVSWSASNDTNSDGFKGYNVYRYMDVLPNDTTASYLSQFKANSSVIAKGTTSYRDTLQISNANFYYHVRSVNDEGISLASDNGTQPSTIYKLTAPDTVWVSNDFGLSGKTLRVTWNESSDTDFADFKDYEIWRMESDNYRTNITADSVAANGSSVGFVSASMEFQDSGSTISEGKVYYYAVVARNTSNDIGTLGGFEFNATTLTGDNEIIYEFSSPLLSGFSFVLGKEFSMMSSLADSIDIYLGTANDASSDTELLLKSPHLAGGSFSSSSIYMIGDDWNVTTLNKLEFGNNAACENGKVYALEIKNNTDGSGSTHYVKLMITDMQQTAAGSAEGRITFQYSLQPIPDLPRF
ncbi:MAG: hypothetical protein DWQ06_03880 [Calditrichaeota bacterium]|nr:MAG: hypothetical protein DWQ06_03880 [Calditrichota bacterium]